MQTRDEVRRALAAAHERGDTEAASALARRLQSMPQQELPDPVLGGGADLPQSTVRLPRTEPGEAREETGAVGKAPAPIRLGQALLSGARRGFEGAAGTLGATGNLLANVPGLGALENPYGFEGAEEAGRNLFGPNFTPSGRVEEGVSLAGEFVGGAGPAGVGRQATTRGLSVGRNIVRTLNEEMTPAAGAIAGQQLAYGEDYQNLAELAGGLSLGLGVSGRRALTPTGEQIIADRLSEATPEDFARARRLSEIATEMGFPITPDEALGNPSLQVLAAQVQTGDLGMALAAQRQKRLDSTSLDSLSDLAEESPGRFRAVMERFVEENLQQTNRPAATAIAKGEEAAQELRNRRTRLARPYYEAASQPGQDVSEEAVSGLVDSIDGLIAQQPEGSARAARLNQLRRGLIRTDENGEQVGLQTNAGTLDSLYQEFQDLINIKPGDPRSTLAEGVGVTLEPVSILREITEQNPNIRRGRDVYRRYTTNVLQPLLQGPLGALSRGDPDSLKRLRTLTENVISGGDFDLGDFVPFVNRLSAVEGGPEALEGLLGAYMLNVAEDSLDSTASGRRQNPAAYFSSRIEGRHRANLNALFQALDMADQRAGRPNPPNRRRAFSNLMNVLQSTQGPTAARPGGVSDTEVLTRANASVLTRLLQVARPLATPASVLSQEFAERRNRALVRETWETIGEAFADTSPEGINRIEQMASASGSGPQAVRAATELLTRAGFVETSLDENESDEQ